MTVDHQEPEDAGAAAAGLPPAPPWSPQTKLALAGALVAAGLIIGWLVRGVLPVLALSALIAFLLAPAIRWLHTRLRMPRWAALLLTYLLVLVATVAFGILVAGSLLSSIRELDPAGTLESVRTWLLHVLGDSRTVTVLGIRLDLSEAVGPIEGWLQGQGGLPVGGGEVEEAVTISAQTLRFLFGSVIGSVRTVVGLIVAIFTSVLVTTLVAMYLSTDSRRYHQATLRLVPAGYEGDALRMTAAVKAVWTGFLYGQLLNSLITGVMVGLVLALVGLPGAFLMGFIMLVLNMIPTIGPILAAVPGVLLALIEGSNRLDIGNLAFGLLVTAIYVAVVQLQANLIAPKVMGSAVKLRPAIVMLGLIAGLQIGGLLGSLLAVPVIATLRIFTRYVYYRLIGRDPWEPEPASDAEPSAAAA